MGLNYVLEKKIISEIHNNEEKLNKNESIDNFEIKDEDIIEAEWQEDLYPLEWSINYSLSIDEEEYISCISLDKITIECESGNCKKEEDEEDIVEAEWEEGIDFIEFSINSPIFIDDQYFFL